MWSTALCEMQMFIDSYSVKYQEIDLLKAQLPEWLLSSMGHICCGFGHYFI